LRAGRASGGLLDPGGVEDQFAEEFAGGGVDDADVVVLDQEQDVGPASSTLMLHSCKHRRT